VARDRVPVPRKRTCVLCWPWRRLGTLDALIAHCTKEHGGMKAILKALEKEPRP